MRFSIPDLLPGTDYVIQVRGSKGDKHSKWSPVFKMTTLTDTVKPGLPTSITWVASGDSFHAEWDAVSRNINGNIIPITRYELEITGAGTPRIVSVPPASDAKNVYDLSHEANRALFGGTPRGSLSLRIRSVDNKNMKSDWSAAIVATNAAPAPLASVKATALVDSISLEWSAGADTDLIGYNVYSSGGSKIAFVTNLSYLYVTTFYGAQSFIVKVVDKFYQESTGTASNTVTPASPFIVDVGAPDTPVFVPGSSSIVNNVSGVGAQATVTWTQAMPSPNDLQGFEIRFKSPADSTWFAASRIDVLDRTAKIPLSTAYSNYDFQIRSVDRSANYSAWSSAMTLVAPVNQPPGNVTGLTATPGKDNITFSWTALPDTDIKNYEFTIAKSADFTASPLSLMNGTSSTLSVGGLDSATTYYARVRAIDTGGLISPSWSSTVSASTTTFPGAAQSDGVAPTSSPTPVISPGIGNLFVQWLPISNPDLTTYEVHISTTSGFTPSASTKNGELAGTFVLISALPNSTTPLSYGTTYYVRLIAKDRDGSAPVGSQSFGVPLKVGANDSNLTAANVGADPAGSATKAYNDAKAIADAAQLAADNAARDANATVYTVDPNPVAVDAWLQGVYYVPNHAYGGLPSYELIRGIKPTSTSLRADGQLMQNTLDNYVGFARTLVTVTTQTTLSGTWLHDDGGALYVDGILIASQAAYGSQTFSVSIAPGLHVIDTMWSEASGGEGVTFTPSIKSQVATLRAPLSLDVEPLILAGAADKARKDADAKIANLVIGGLNLKVNSNWELPDSNENGIWIINGGGNVGVRSTVKKYNGSWSYRVEPGVENWGYYEPMAGPPYVIAGKEYTFSVWVNSDTTQDLVLTNYQTPKEGSTVTCVANVWTRLTLTQTLAPNASNVYIGVRRPGRTTMATPFYMDAFKIEEGSKATTWSPNPQDTLVAAASDTDTRITNYDTNTAKPALAIVTDLAKQAQQRWQSNNPTFDVWPDGQDRPSGTFIWNNTPIRETVYVKTKPYSLRMQNADEVENGLFLGGPGGISGGQIMGGVSTSKYLTVTTEFMVLSGKLGGAGILVDWILKENGATHRTNLRLTDFISNANLELNKWIQLTVVVKRDTVFEDSAYSHVQGYLMGSWAGLGTREAKDIVWDRLDWRPSTPEEINAYEAPGRILTAQNTATAADIKAGQAKLVADNPGSGVNLYTKSRTFTPGDKYQFLQGGMGVSLVNNYPTYKTNSEGGVVLDSVIRLTGTDGFNYRIRELRSPNTWHTISFWAKSNTSSNQNLGVDVNDDVETFVVTPTWQKFTMTKYALLLNSTYNFTDFGAGPGAVDILIYEPMLETGRSASGYSRSPEEILSIGQNLYLNSSFEKDKGLSANVGAVSYADDGLVSGSRSMRLTRTAAGDCYTLEGADVPAAVNGQPVTVSFNMKSNNGGGIDFQPEGPGTYFTQRFEANTDVNGKRFSYTVTPDGTSNWHLVYRTGGNVGDYAIFDAVQIEYGTVATTWKPNPKDAVDQAKTYTDTTVVASANGKNKVTHSENGPTGTGIDGDTWYRENASGNVIEMYRWHQGQWKAVALNHEVMSSIDIGKATVGTLDVANRVAAGSITTKQLSIGDPTNLVFNFNDNADRVNYPLSTGFTWSPSGAEGFRLLVGTTATSTILGAYTTVKPGEQLNISLNWYKTGATSEVVGVHFVGYGKDGAYVSEFGLDLANASGPSDQWNASGTNYTVPDGIYGVTPILRRHGGNVGGNWYFRDLYVKKRFGGSLIVDGAIEASKLSISVGGGNELSNSNFESLPVTVSPWNAEGNASLSITSVDRFSGTYSLLNTHSSVGGGVSAFQYVPTIVGQQYVLTGWVKRAAGAGGVVLTSNANITKTAFVSAPTTWTRLVHKFVATSTTTTLYAYNAASYGGATPGSGSAFYLDNVQLEKGDVETAYAPRADEILPGTISTPMLQANSVKADNIDAGAIRARNLSITLGGGNLLSYSSWKGPVNLSQMGWTVYTSTGGSAFPNSGNSYSGGYPTLLVYGNGGDTIVYKDVYGLQPGQSYTFSVWCYNESQGDDAHIVVHDTQGGNSVGKTATVGGWSRLVIAGWVANGLGAVRLHCYSGANSNAYFTQAQLETGDVPTSYSPKADEILPGTIYSPMIVSGEIKTENLDAGAVKARNLSVTIGGGNLLADGGFESGIPGTHGWVSAGTTNVVYDNQDAVAGSKRRVRMGNATFDAYLRPGTGINSILVRRGQKYTISAYVYKSGGATEGSNRVMSIDHGPRNGATTTFMDGISPSADTTGVTYMDGTLVNGMSGLGANGWNRIKMTFTAMDDCISPRLYASQTANLIYWDNVQLEEGEVPTTYSAKSSEILPGTISGDMLQATTAIVTTLDINPGGVIKSSNYNAANGTGWRLGELGLDIRQGSVAANTLIAGTGIIDNLLIKPTGGIQSTNFTSTSGYRLSSTGLELNDSGSSIKADAIKTGVIGNSGGQAIQIASGSSLVFNFGHMRSSNYGSASYNSAATAGFFISDSYVHIPQGNVAVSTLTSGTLNATTINLADAGGPKGVIQSLGYDGSSGFRLSPAGLEVPNGSILASKIVLQAGTNMMHPIYSDFESDARAYDNFGGQAVISCINMVASKNGNAVFGGSSLGTFWGTNDRNPAVYLGRTQTDYNVPFTAGQNYLVSAYVWCAGSVATNVQMNVKFPNGSIVTLATYNLQSGGGPNTAIRISGQVTAPVNNGLLYFESSTWTANAGFNIDGVQVEPKTSGTITPSPWTPGSSTYIDANQIRTGEIRSTVNDSTTGQPTWVINMVGKASFSGASIYGNTVIGNGTNDNVTVMASSNYNFGSRLGWQLSASGSIIATEAQFVSNVPASNQSNNRPAVIIGEKGGAHMRMSDNRIVAMAGDTTQDLLYLNQGGRTISTKFQVESSEDASTAAGNQPPMRIGPSNGNHMRIGFNDFHVMANDSTMTAGSLGLNPQGRAVMGTTHHIGLLQSTGAVSLRATASAFGTVQGGVDVRGGSSINGKIVGVGSTVAVAWIGGTIGIVGNGFDGATTTFAAGNTQPVHANNYTAWGSSGFRDMTLNGQTGSTANINGNGVLIRTPSSSIRYKENISEITLDHAKGALKLNAVTFQYKEETEWAKDEPGRIYTGVIAEQAHDAGMGLWVIYNPDGSIESFRYEQLAVAHNVLIKDLYKKNATLETQVAEQATTISDLESRMRKIEELLSNS